MARRIFGKRRAGNEKQQMGRAQQIAALLAVLAAGILTAALLGGSSYALNLVTGGTTDTTRSLQASGPTISSDKDDYNPGNTVTLTGHNWAPDESVHVSVNDDIGQTWSFSTDVTADANGDFTVQFQLPMTFIASYSVTATGATSGTATTSFTDGNLTLHLATGQGVTSMTVAYQSFGKNNAADTTCSGTGTTPGASPKAITAGGTASIGIQSFESVKLGAVTSAPPGFVFDRWTTGTSTTDSGNTVSGSPTPCIGGVSSGSNGNVTDLYAHFTPANHNPVINKNNASVTVNEGQAASNSGTWSDADSGDTVTLSASVGTVTKSGTNASGTWSWSYTPDDGPASSTVTITANDGNGGTASTSFSLSVSNVAPTASITGAPASSPEGTAISLGSNVTDPSSADTSAGFTRSWTITKNGNPFASGSGASFSFTPDDNGTYVVNLSATDKDGGTGTDSKTISVTNVRPTANITGAPGSSPEGTAISLGSTVTDPSSVDTTAGFTRSWSVTKNGNPYGSTGSGTTFSFTPDDNGTYVVTFTATDKDGGSGSDSKTINVTNVAPSVAAASDQSSVEGSGASFTLGSFSDPGANDSPWSVDVSWGDGSGHSTFTESSVGSLGSQSHTYDDSGTYTVTVTVTDKDGGAGSNTFHVSVGNVAPTATFSNDGPINEGSPVTVSFSGQHDPSSADTTAGFHYAYSCTGADLSGATYGGSSTNASSQCTFDDNGTYTVSGAIIDKDGGINPYTTTVTINNAAPTVTPGSGSATEGVSGSFSLGSFTDPGTHDNPWSVDVDWGDGTPHSTFNQATQGSLGMADHTYADGPNTYTVTVKVTDKDGGSGQATFSVDVLNSPPVVTAAADQSVDEGTSKSFNLGSFTDSGANDHPWAVDVNWGDGHSDSYDQNTQGTIAAEFHTFDDGPHTYTVTVKVTDKDGGFNTKMFHVDVANVAPTATLLNDGPTDEGSNATISFSGQSDPSSADTAAGFHYTYACDGNAASLSTSYASALMGASATCLFPDGPDSHPVLARIYDKDNGFTQYSTTVIVNNVAPTVTAPADQNADEGTSTSFNPGSFSDPGVNDAPWSVYVDWGDSSPASSFTQNSQGTITAHSHTYADNGTYTVSVNVQDKDLGSTTKTFKITVANVPPLVIGASDQSLNEGQSVAFSLGSFTDRGAGDGPWSVDVNWGDSSTHTTFSSASQGDLGARSHTYADNGSYTVTVSVTDKDGGTGSAQFTINVANLAPQVTAAADQTASEGTSKSFNLGSFSDAGVNDHPWSVDVDWGDGSADTTFSTGSQGPIDSKDHTYDDNRSYTVTVTVTDKDGGSGQSTFSVDVANVAPTATLSSSGPIDEGSSATVSFSAQHDPSNADTAAGFHYAFSCSNGDLSGATYAGSGTAGSTTCSFDDNGTYPVKARIIDKDGGYGEYTTTVVVNNVAPTATLSNSGPIDEGSSATVSFSAQHDPSNADTAAGFHYPFSCSNGDLSGATYAGSGTAGSTTCSFDDNGTYPVKARIIDKDGGYGEYTTNVVVNNVPPSVTAPADQSSDEGSSHSFSLGSFTDPGADSPWTVSVDWGDGHTTTGTRTTTGGLGTSDHTYDDNGDYTATVTVTDNDGAPDHKTFKVSVANIAPTATLSNNGPVNEGSPATVTFSNQQDPSSADTTAGFHYAYDCSGGSLAGATYASSGTSASKMCTFPDNGTYPVSGRIIDKDGGFTDYTTTVTVNNVNPTVTAPSDQSSNEGSSASFNLGSFSDPGPDSPWAVDVNWGDGSGHTTFNKTSTGSLGSQSHTYDDNGSYTVTVKVTDKDNGSGQATFTVNVANVNPTATLSNNGPVDEGSPATISFGNQSDPSSADTTAGLHYAYSCSNSSLAGTTYAGSGTSASTTCTFPDNGTYTVKGRIIDKDGGYSEYTTDVNVNNVNPMVTPPSNQTANEGAGTSFNLGSFSDPGADSPWSVDVNWGDGGSHYTTTKSATGSLGSLSHTYADNGTYTVTVTVTDKDGGSGWATFTINVANVNPSVTAPAEQSSSEGSSASFNLGSFTDPGANDGPWSVDVNWGDGGSNYTTTKSATGSLGSASHTYADNGTYTVTVTVTDKDGGSGQATFKVTVANVSPTVTAPTDQTADEGASTSLSLGSFSDPGASDGPWAVDVNWGDPSAHATFNQSSQGSLGSQSHTYADNGIYTVTVKVTDKDGGSGQATFKVTVSNVPPTITAFSGTTSLSGPLVFVPATFNGTFTDPGKVDNPWTATWSWDGTADATATQTYPANGTDTHNFTQTHQYTSASCGHTATVKITDKDGGSDTKTVTVGVGTGAFLPPMTNQPVTNKLKNGQVLPVKIQMTDCSGAPINNLTPAIRLVAGDQTAVFDDSSVAITPQSVSNADTTGQMRSSGTDGSYIYNMNISIPLNQDYTVVIYPYWTSGTPSGPTLRHVIQATK